MSMTEHEARAERYRQTLLEVQRLVAGPEPSLPDLFTCVASEIEDALDDKCAAIARISLDSGVTDVHVCTAARDHQPPDMHLWRHAPVMSDLSTRQRRVLNPIGTVRAPTDAEVHDALCTYVPTTEQKWAAI